jgi:hypothetical protein
MIAINKFVLRQTKKNFCGTKVSKFELNKICEICNEFPKSKWKQGYAPFCFIIPITIGTFPVNYCNFEFPLLKINESNKHLLEIKYKARRNGELPVLSRYFKNSPKLKKIQSKKINVIVYSKEQLVKETPSYVPKGDFEIISINAELDFEIPMTPDTIIRNHLGTEFGGSGHPLNKKEYMKSVKFWSEWAFIAE